LWLLALDQAFMPSVRRMMIFSLSAVL
jgi:hypothetical protein